MKQSRLLSTLTTLLLGVGFLVFIPTIATAAPSAVTCNGSACSQTFTYSNTVQTFTPPTANGVLTITLYGAAGGKGGDDSAAGGAGYGGSKLTFNYTPTSTAPLYIYTGSAGGNGSFGAGGGSQGAGGVNPWAIYNGGRGGTAGTSCCSGGGGGGGAATLISTGAQSGVIGVAGGGGGGGGGNISGGGIAGRADTGTQTNTTTGAQGSDFGGGDGSAGGGGGAGVTGGTGGWTAGDGSSTGGGPGISGRSTTGAGFTVTGNSNNAAGYATISWIGGPTITTAPSFTVNSTARVGQVLTPVDGTFVANAGTLSISNRRWQISTDGTTWLDITPVETGNYTLKTSDAGKYVRFAQDATDSNGTTAAFSARSLQITEVPIFTAESPSGSAASTMVNTSYAGYTFIATGNRVSYTISSGALPTGMALDAATGGLTGTPTSSGSFTYKVKATNDSGADETPLLTLIVGRSPVFTSNSSVLQSVNRVTNPFRVGGQFPDFTFVTASYPASTLELKTDATTIPACGTGSGCAFPYETIGLPNGISFDPSTGKLSGTATKAGAYVFAIRATNSLGTATEYIHMTVAAKAPQPFALTSDKNAVTLIQGAAVTATVTASGGEGNGAYSFSVDSTSTTNCSLSNSSANSVVITALAAGNCIVVGTKAADGTFAQTRTTVTIPINKAPQTAALVINADANPSTFGVGLTWLRGSGGSGTGAFAWAVDPSSSGVCSTNAASGNDMRFQITAAGNCLVQVTKAADAYFLAQSVQYLLVIDKAQMTGLTVSGPSTVYWNATTPPSYTLSTNGGQGTGSVTFALDQSSGDVCSLVGAVITAKSAGTCSVTATKAGDANYKPMTSPSWSWSILTINQPALNVTATNAAGANLANGSTWLPYVANPTPAAILTVTGGAGTGSYGYSVSGNCVISGAGNTAYLYSPSTGSGQGWCYITVTKAADLNYNIQTFATFNLHFGPANQTTLIGSLDKTSIDFVPTTLTDAATAAKTQITVSGGSGTGAVTYAVAGGSASVCSVDSTGLITDKTAGSCVVNITKAADVNYNSQTISVTVTFNKLVQAELVANPATSEVPFTWSPKATVAITTTGGTGTGLVSYSVDPSSSTVCSVNASTGLITDITAGTCLVLVTKAADTNYLVTTDTVSVVFTKVSPTALNLTPTAQTLTYTNSATKNSLWVSVSGGNYSSGAFTFYIDPLTEEYCSIESVQATQVRVSGKLAGYCLVTVVQASDVNYIEQRAILGFQILKMTQTIGASSSNGASVAYKDSPSIITTINVTGQAGTGQTKFVLDPANTSSCSVDQATGNLTSPTVGSCRITVSRDGDDNVLASNSVVLNLTINKINQAAITLTPTADFKLAAPGSLAASSALTIGIVNTGTGNFTKIVTTTPTVCTITGGGDSSISGNAFVPSLAPSITVTAVDDGTCVLQYSKLGDSNYNATTNATASFVIPKATQSDLSTTITSGSATMPYVASPKATVTIATTGGSGTGVLSYSVDPTSASVCSVSSAGIVTDISAGVCSILVKRLGDTNFADSTTKTVTITFGKIDQLALTLSAQKTSLRATSSGLDTTTLSLTGGTGSGAVTYQVDSSSSSVCSISGTTVTALGAGDCNITATKAADTNYNASSASIKLTVTKGTQSTLSGYWWSSPMAFDPSPAAFNYLVTSGGTGAGNLVASISTSSSTVCTNASVRPSYPNQIQINVLSDGVCTVTVYKSGGLAWDDSNSITQSFTVTKVNQTGLTVTPSKTTLPYFNSPEATFTVGVVGGLGSGALSVNILPASSTVCADASTQNGSLTIKTLSVGTCSFTVTKASSAGYNAITSSQINVTITKGTQVPVIVSATPSQITYSANPKAQTLLSVSGGSGSGALSITVDSSSTAVCTYNDATKQITANQSGKCEMTITKAGDANWNATTTKFVLTINKIAQAKLTLSAITPNLKFNENPRSTTQLVVSGGTGSGSLTYAVDPGSSSVCSLSVVSGVATVTANYYGYCDVTVTKAGDVNYADATASTTVRIAQLGTQIIASTPSQSVSFIPAPGVVSVVTVEGSKAGDLLTYTVDSASSNVCSVAGNGVTAQVTSINVGTCNIIVVNVSRTADGTLIASSATVSLTISKADQSNVTVTPAMSSVNYSVPAATNVITVGGGVANSAISATVDPTSQQFCSVIVSENKVTMTALKVGTCLINLTKAGNGNFNDYSTTVSIPVLKTKQANLVATSSPSTLTYNANTPATTTLSVSGGSGTGAVTYVVDVVSTEICSVTNNIVTALTGGVCQISVSKAEDENYASASTQISISIEKANQSALSVSAGNQNLTFNPDSAVSTTITATGGSGSGAITYTVSSASAPFCSTAGNLVTVIRPGECVVIATKAGDSFFKDSTTSITITIAKANQPDLIAKTAQGQLEQPQWNDQNSTQLVITGGDGYGSLSLVPLTPSICNVNLVGRRVNVTAISSGDCKFNLAQDGDYKFLPSRTLAVTVKVTSSPVDLAVTIASAGKAVAGGQGAIDLTIANVGQLKANGASAVYTLPTGIAATSIPAGCTLSNSQVTCVITGVMNPGTAIRFTIPVSIASNLTGGQYTTGGTVTLTPAIADSNPNNNNLTGNLANFIVNSAPISFNKTTIGALQTGKDFTDQLLATAYPAATYTISSGDLPAGLNLNESTGEISGKPTGVGKYAFTVSAYNSAGAISQAFSGTIAPAPFVTAPAAGFGTNTVPAGTKVTIAGINLDLINQAIIGGKTVKILSKVSGLITLEVPNATTSGEAPISLVYNEVQSNGSTKQVTIDGGSFTYTGTAKKTPVIVINAGLTTAGAGENSRTLTAGITAPDVSSDIDIPVTFTSKTTSVCTVAGNQLSFLAAGVCTVGASTTANAAFNAATATNVSITVTKSSQNLTGTLPQDTVPATPATDSADGFDLQVISSSGLSPVFASTTPTICDVTEDGHVTGIKVGRCIVKVTQPGDARFNAALAITMEFDIATDSGSSSTDNGDPLHPTSVAGGNLLKKGDAGFTWDKKLGNLQVETYGLWIGKINAVSEFTISGKTYKCSVDFGILKAMPSKTAAQLKAALSRKIFKANKPFCNGKTEKAAWTALKNSYAGLNVKVTITRYRMHPITYRPVNPQNNKPMGVYVKIVYLTLG